MRIKFIQNLIDKKRNKKTFKQIWKEKNSHNGIDVVSEFNIDNVTVGKESYGSINVISYGYPNEKLTIGNFCSIALNTTFFLSSGHDYKTLSTYPFRKFYFDEEFETPSKGEIIVEDDVWIADKCTIMPGVRIGQRAVIALGSVVTKDVAPYSIVGGVPAKHIKYRFPQEICNKLNNIDYSRINKDLILKNRHLVESNINESNIDSILKAFPLKNKEKNEK